MDTESETANEQHGVWFWHSKKKTQNKNCNNLYYIRFPTNGFLPNKQFKNKMKNSLYRTIAISSDSEVANYLEKPLSFYHLLIKPDRLDFRLTLSIS